MHLTLHLTGRCNLHCRYCYVAPHGEDMTVETALAAVRLALARIPQETPDQSMGIIFFGGEPLLQRDLIVETIRYCRQIEAQTGQQFHYKITTNGLLLDEEFLTGPDTSEVFVALSHDGVQAAHDTHRRDAAGLGSFDRLAPKIDLLLKHKPYSPVMMTVNPDTVHHFADSIRFLFARGFHYFICSLNYAADWQLAHLKTLRRQYGELADWYYEQTLKEEKFYLSPFEVKIASHLFKKKAPMFIQKHYNDLFPLISLVEDSAKNR